MTALKCKCEIPYCSTIETRSLNVLELIDSIFGLAPSNAVNIEPSIINENWPQFKIISGNFFAVNYLLVPCNRISCLVVM